MKFLDFKSITIFFEFIKNHHYTFYIMLFISYLISCYIYFYQFFAPFDFDFFQYFSILDILKLSNIETLLIFISAIGLGFLVTIISLFGTYLWFKKRFKGIESKFDTIDNEIKGTISQVTEEFHDIENEIHQIYSEEEYKNSSLFTKMSQLQDHIKNEEIKLLIAKNEINDVIKEGLKIKFSMVNLVFLFITFTWYNYTFSETMIKKHEYPTAKITFIEENKTRDYKLLGNLETSILLSDENLTKLEIIEKSNIVSISINNNHESEK